MLALQRLVTSGSTPGAQYLFLRRGNVVVEECAGVADALRGERVSPATTFNAYSLTKPFTAALLVAMAHEGKVDLDLPIGAALRVEGLEGYGSVREVLLHRAHVPNPNPLGWTHDARAHATFDEAEFTRHIIARLQAGRPSARPFGYSNPGYVLLGELIARSAGTSYSAAMTERLVGALELGSDATLAFRIPDVEVHARGHLRRLSWPNLLLGLLADRAGLVEQTRGRWVGLRLHHVNGSAYGGLVANARGLAAFGCAVLGQRPGFAPAVRQALIAPVPGPGPSRSLGWFLGETNGQRWAAHAGGGLGYYAELRVYPDSGCVSALLLNRVGFSHVRMLSALDEPLLRGRD